MTKKRIAVLLAGAAVIATALAAGLPRSKAPADAEVYFISPNDGETVASPLAVRFGLRGMGIAPAGVAFENAGHHHLLIDAELPALDRPIPADANHVHFGKGQTESVITLAPGRHRLQLLLADHFHIPHDPPVMSKPITVIVR
ncbi:MAG TPA: DUF4399 domain-containing protein [Steroidobacteraceae bacterium]